MAIILDGTTGITTPGLINTGSETVVNLSTTGTTTLGDASGDALTINSSAVSIPNGLNFDSNTFVIDATNNRVGVGLTSPAYAFDAEGDFRHRNFAGGSLSGFFNCANTGSVTLNFGGTTTPNKGRIFYSDNSDLFSFFTNSTERMRIDSSGNVGIGTSSPASPIHVQRSNDGTIGTFRGTSNAQLLLGISSGNLVYDSSNGNATHVWQSNTTERMRIDSSGNLLVGASSGNYQLTTYGSTYNAAKLGILTTGRSGSEYPSVGYNVRYTATASSYTYDAGDFASMIKFQSGQIQTFTAANGTGGATISFTSGPYVANGGTSWTNSSDERLKDIIEPIENAITKVSSLRTVIGKFKTDEEGTRRSFLIAQDVQAVLPEAVDASDPDKLGVQYTDVIPLLVAAIKEQQAIIQQLQADVAALKGA
jgi:hypothetical protein